MNGKSSLVEVRLQAECEQLKMRVAEWESRCQRDIDWFHQQVREIQQATDMRVEEKDKEIVSLKMQIRELKMECDKHFAKSLEKMHDMQSVWNLQEVLLQKRAEIETEALARETRFSRDKQQWIDRMEQMKERSNKVLQTFEDEYKAKEARLNDEYAQRSAAITNNEEILQSKTNAYKEKEEVYRASLNAAEIENQQIKDDLARIQQKPLYDPPAGIILPLVREALVDHAIPRLMQAVAGRTRHLLDQCIQQIPERQRTELQPLKDRIEQDTASLATLFKMVKLTIQPVSIELIVEDALKKLETDITEHHIEIKKEYAEHIPHPLCDPQYVLNTFMYVIRNAIEAMQSGGTLSIAIKRDNRNIEVIVRDTGEGISKKNEEHIFTPFFTTRPGALGLGLYLSRLNLQAMNAQITVESPGAKGTTVTCVFQVPEAAQYLQTPDGSPRY